MFRRLEPDDTDSERVRAILGAGSAVVYDGDCPFCSRYVRLVRLRETLGRVDLIDARRTHPIVDLIAGWGFDLNEGMVFINVAEISSGADCVHRLALLSGPRSAFNRVNHWIFRSATLSRLLYPVLRLGRNATLALIGREKIPDGIDKPQDR